MDNQRYISFGDAPSTKCSGFCNWGTDEPNNFGQSENAVAVRDSGWNDAKDTHKLNFICHFQCSSRYAPLKTVQNGGDDFNNVSITPVGNRIRVVVEPEVGAGFVVGPPMDELSATESPAQVLIKRLWPDQTETHVVSKFHQPADNLDYDHEANCWLIMTKPIDKFCGPPKQLDDDATYFGRECGVNLCKLYAANEAKTQLRLAKCSTLKFELRFNKNKVECTTQTPGLQGCSPVVQALDWATNSVGNFVYFRALPSVTAIPTITKIECQSTIMDCSSCRPGGAAGSMLCLTNNNTDRGGSHKTEQVRMLITARMREEGPCASKDGNEKEDPSSCSDTSFEMTYTATLTQLRHPVTSYNFRKFALNFNNPPNEILFVSRSDRVHFDISVIESGVFGITKFLLVGKKSTINVLAEWKWFDVRTEFYDEAQVLGDGSDSGGAPAGVAVTAGSTVMVSFSLASLSDFALDDSYRMVVGVLQEPLTISVGALRRRHRRQEAQDEQPPSSQHVEVTLVEICLRESCDTSATTTESQTTKHDRVVVGLACALSVAVVALIALLFATKKMQSNRDNSNHSVVRKFEKNSAKDNQGFDAPHQASDDSHVETPTELQDQQEDEQLPPGAIQEEGGGRQPSVILFGWKLTLVSTS